MVAVIIPILYAIFLQNLHYVLPESILSWEVCYIYFRFRSDYSTVPELHMRLYLYVCASYNGVCIYMFVYVIQYNCWLYFILGILSYIYPMYGLFFHCIVVTFTIV